MTSDTAVSTAELIPAAGALLGMLTRFTTLPAPEVSLDWVRDDEWRDPKWGVCLSFRKNTADFEKWRQAVGIAPAAVRSVESSTGAGMLLANGTFAGVRVQLFADYDPPTPEGTAR
ncbi:hypothetical protein C7C46_12365 [Streptomyces tateyamensis]|uniref:Uncharacterized protein n=1 Tax=Streptomyces tateyamensis TaxID=565073 RepID=A0A2V4NVC2_9ACTN|nr:hypothetical protein [Streptomyces tateyamensis]PYC80491.1 hypothetical protein C7C46_12365 [Streptomyces tateyamensis]